MKENILSTKARKEERSNKYANMHKSHPFSADEWRIFYLCIAKLLCVCVSLQMHTMFLWHYSFVFISAVCLALALTWPRLPSELCFWSQLALKKLFDHYSSLSSAPVVQQTPSMTGDSFRMLWEIQLKVSINHLLTLLQHPLAFRLWGILSFLN